MGGLDARSRGPDAVDEALRATPRAVVILATTSLLVSAAPH